MEGVLKEFISGRNLCDFAQVHNCDLIRNIPHQTQIVGNEKISKVEFFLQP
ncbi:unnamed protein product, partial [marine sediment metagenome]